MLVQVMQLELIGLEGDKAGIDGISICMELWRADMLTHVIEVDSNSKIVPTTGEMKKLYPAGRCAELKRCGVRSGEWCGEWGITLT